MERDNVSGSETHVKLQWSRLLGFDQATQSIAQPSAAALNDPRLTKLGAKIGEKSAGKRPL